MFLLKKYPKLFGMVSALLVATTLTACFSSSGNNTSTTTAAVASVAITSTAPALDQTAVGIDSKVVAVFNKAMKSETLTETSFTLKGANETAVSGAVSYDELTRTAIFTPGSNLNISTLYTATITTAVKDDSNKSLLENYVWTFTTGAATDDRSPELASSSPAHDDTGVLLNAKVSVIFDEAIDPATITASSFQLTDSDVVSGSLLYVNPTTVVFTPSSDMKAETAHTLTLNNAIKDLAGNRLAEKTIKFTTGSDVSSSPATVDLGTAGNYVILAKDTITTTGTTKITGDIGVSPAARTFLTGFSDTLDAGGTFSTSDIVTGQLFAANMTSPTPSNLTTAVSNMETAYTDAAKRPDPDFTELGAGEIGGLTLDPGLYKWGTGVLVTSDVTLNGSAEDIWIFQIGQDLKLQDGKAVILTGGALPENVFWQVAGEVTLQAATTFNGIILTQTAVEMKSGAVVNGRVLAQTAVTMIANTVSQP